MEKLTNLFQKYIYCTHPELINDEYHTTCVVCNCENFYEKLYNAIQLWKFRILVRLNLIKEEELPF